jgi:uncharacterized hydrophobic protein (TIGR00271 family)
MPILGSTFRNVTEKEKDDAIQGIIQHASPRADFFLMMILSISMAVFGVILNNTIVLIGSMLIAPLLYCLLSLALGIIDADQKLILRSLYTLIKCVGLGLAAGILIGFFFAPRDVEMMFPLGGASAVPSSLGYVIVAAIAGFAAAFAMTKPHLNETLPGVAISVALVPPLAVAGVGLSILNWDVVSSALLLFLVNVVGVLFSAMIVFSMLQFSVKKRLAQEVLKKDDIAVKKEVEAS